MRNFIKIGLRATLCLAVAFVCLFSFSACKKKISDTTTDMGKTSYNNTQTNGGITAVYNGYLYFINGTKTKAGDNLKENTRSAICRVKIDNSGKIDENSYEVVVDDLVGYDYGSINFFGNFMYYATPNSAVNYEDTVLFNQTKFIRYDLVNKKDYTIYTTKQNDSNEKLSYAYYVNGNELDLVVYESVSSTLTSIKVDTKMTTNYVIENVKNCVLSDHYGKCEKSGATSDANNFIFYTKSSTDNDSIKADKVYRVSPNTNNSKRIYNGSETVSILSVKNGKLYYSLSNDGLDSSVVYAQAVTNNTESLDRAKSSIISYESYDNIVFFEGADNITAIVHNSDSNQVNVLVRNSNNPLDITPVYINSLTAASSSSDSKAGLSFIGVTTVNEKVKTEVEGEEKTEKVTYLIYSNNKIVYKQEIMREGEISSFIDPIKLSTTNVCPPSSYLVPEIIGNYLYIFANEVGEDDKETDNVYLYRVDITIDDDSKDKATFVGMKEADKEEDKK